MSSQTEYTHTVLISLHLTKVKENHLRCFFKSPSLRVSHSPGHLSCAWGMTALHVKNFPANCNGWFISFSILLGDLSKDEFAVPVSVNVEQECLQGLWGIVPLLSVAPHSEKYTQIQFFTGCPLERLWHILKKHTLGLFLILSSTKFIVWKGPVQVLSYLFGQKNAHWRENKILSLLEVKTLLQNVFSCLLVKWQGGFELEFSLDISGFTKNKEEQGILKLCM